MRKRVLKFLSLWLPPVLWALMIFSFSSGGIPKASPSFWVDFVIKKVGHMLLYGALALLLYRALRNEGVNRKKAAVWSVFAAVFYGATDEFHQSFIQGREARPRDVLFDLAGAALAVYLVYQFLPKLPKKVQSFLLKCGVV